MKIEAEERCAPAACGPPGRIFLLLLFVIKLSFLIVKNKSIKNNRIMLDYMGFIGYNEPCD